MVSISSAHLYFPYSVLSSIEQTPSQGPERGYDFTVNFFEDCNLRDYSVECAFACLCLLMTYLFSF